MCVAQPHFAKRQSDPGHEIRLLIMSGPHYASPESYKGKCGQDVWSTSKARLPVEQSRRHGWGFGGLSPPKQSYKPPQIEI